jgi:hypothetical protein
MAYVSGLKAEGQAGRYCKLICELQTLNVNYLNLMNYCFYLKQHSNAVS